jgi:hypothetical protein
MRLIRPKVYRAFPELDRFTDEQCSRFVAAANSSWRRRLLRWTLVGLAGVMAVVAACAAIVSVNLWIQDLLRVEDVGGSIVAIVVGGIGFAIALVPTLILRDFLLRRTLRRLIRRCGACPKCHYSLLGMRVGPDQTITCPECGLKIDVDASMGELATDEEGAAVYKPEVTRDHAITKERRRRRHRIFFRAMAAAAALLVLSAAGYWLFLENQARRAIHDRAGASGAVEQIRKVQMSMWPSGAQWEDGVVEFERYLALVKACATLQDARNFTPPPMPPATPGATPVSPPNINFDASTLLPSTSAATYDKQGGEGAYAACRAFTLDALQRGRANGKGGEPSIVEDLKELLTLKAPMRPMAPEDGEPFFGTLVPDLSFARGTARFNGARMIQAVQSGDRAEYMEAMEESLAIAQIVERQGLLIDRLVAISIQSLVYRRLNEDKEKFPDAAWFEDALAILKRRGAGVGFDGHPSLSKMMDVERIGGLDSIAWYFSSPMRIAKATIGIGDDNPFGLTVRPGISIGTVGTYGQNKAVWNKQFAGYIAAADAPMSKRSPISTPPTGLSLLDQLTPSVVSVFRSDDNGKYEARMCQLNLACDLFKLRNGRPPNGPDEIAELIPDPAALIDPLSDKPYRFVIRDASGKDGKAFEIRDGQDDEAKPGQPPKPKPPAKPAAKPEPKK